NFREEGHLYTVSHLLSDGVWSEPRDVTGVTTIKEIISKPGLVPWAAGLAAQTTAELIKESGSLEESAIIEAVKKGRRAHDAVRQKGGRGGTHFHSMVEHFLKGEEVPSHRNSQEQFERFVKWWQGV